MSPLPPPPLRSSIQQVRTAICSASGLGRSFHYSPTKLHQQQQQPQSLDEVGPLACPLKSRSVIRFRGPDTIKFLQGLLTNDVRPLAGTPTSSGSGDQTAGADPSSSSSYMPTPNLPLHSPPPIYAALLTPQGRFLYDLFLYRPAQPQEKLDRTGSGPGSGGPDELPTLFADVDALVLDELLDCLRKYRLRSKVEIDNVTEDFSCWQCFGGDLSSSSGGSESAAVGWGRGIDHAGASAAQGSNLGWQWYKDPRLDCLGCRGVFSSKTIPPLVESDKEVDERHYIMWRIERGVAEGSTEIQKGEAIPLEYNLSGLNAISFDKGCYVGQESVARTHHRGVIRKRLLPLKFTDNNGTEVEQRVASGSEVVVDATSNKKVGVVTTALGCRGMGLLRLEEVFKSPSLVFKEHDDAKVEVIRPKWWPREWTEEHEQQSAVA